MKDDFPFQSGGEQMSEELWGGPLLQWDGGLMWALPHSLCYMRWYNPQKYNTLSMISHQIYSDQHAWVQP